jgi:general secretion pathway protein I
MKAASDHLNSVEQIEQITFATWVANNRLNQLQLDPSWPLKNNYKGSQDMAGHTWYWQQRVEKTSDKEMVRVEVTVGLDEQYVGGITTVTTFITQQNKT